MTRVQAPIGEHREQGFNLHRVTENSTTAHPYGYSQPMFVWSGVVYVDIGMVYIDRGVVYIDIGVVYIDMDVYVNIDVVYIEMDECFIYI